MNKTSNNNETATDVYTVLATGLLCKECGNEMNKIDETYSNIKTERCNVGQHTGDIYECKFCDITWIDNAINGKLEPWSY